MSANKLLFCLDKLDFPICKQTGCSLPTKLGKEYETEDECKSELKLLREKLELKYKREYCSIIKQGRCIGGL